MRFLPLLFLLLVISGCVEPITPFNKLPPGIWRATLLLDREPVMKYGDDRDIVKKFNIDSELPFNFEVVYDDAENFHIVIHNAEERIEVRDITFERDNQTAKDTVVINFSVYDTQIRAIYEDGVMEGNWIVNYRDNYLIPFKAVHGKNFRIEGTSDGHDINVEGTWATTFAGGTDGEFKAIGEFKQNGDIVTGTFQTETGDFRYLEGKVLGDKIYLSAFDGAHAYFFLGKIFEDGTIAGNFRSGSTYNVSWEARRDEKAMLKDAYSMTKVLEGPVDFTFINEAGKPVSIHDPEYNGKLKLLQIMGSWCPNCKDETVFLKEYFSSHDTDDLALISLGFERYKDTLRSLEALKKFKNGFDVDNEVLLAAFINEKEDALNALRIENVLSYPTLLFLDRDNNIRFTHTGFYGPATSEYEKFKTEFDDLINKLRQANQ